MPDSDPAVFNPAAYGPEVARVLEMDGGGQRLMPLACAECTNAPARHALLKTIGKTMDTARLFPKVKDPAAAAAGLWLYFSCFEEAHELVSESETPECELWHAILHRREPDSGNAAYWFRKVGTHPTFSPTARAADEIVRRLPDAEFRLGKWDPFAFIAFCERAREQPGSTQEVAAMEIQRAEWQILFDYCARPISAVTSGAAKGQR
jgi:hypothetical protein